jgi:hypothetical protein
MKIGRLTQVGPQTRQFVEVHIKIVELVQAWNKTRKIIHVYMKPREFYRYT